MCFQGLKVNIVPMIPRYNKFTKARIRVPSRSPVHDKSESSIDEDNILAISPPIVKGTSWNLRDFTFHRQGVFDKKRKNWTLAPLGETYELRLDKKTPKGAYAGCVGVRKNYRYGERQWKVE